MSKRDHYVYVLTDPRPDDRRCYVGAAFGNPQRMYAHTATHGAKSARPWLAELKAAGLEPVRRVVLRCEPAETSAYEKKVWDVMRSKGFVMVNHRPGRAAMVAWNKSLEGCEARARPEAKVRHRAATKAAVNQPDVKARHRENTRAALARPEVKQHYQDAMTTVRARPGYHEKMSRAKLGNQNRKGIPHTAETREHLSGVLSGRIISPEHRTKIAAGLRGKKKSAQHRARIREAKAGKPTGPCSAARRAGISVGNKAAWADPAKKAARLEKCQATREKNKAAKNKGAGR